VYELYTWEKLRGLDREARARTPDMNAVPNRTPAGASVARLAGRLLRRFGANLEDWGEARPAPRDCCEACG
jgi:hypothetical protein